MKLSKLLGSVSGTTKNSFFDVEITSVTEDSKRCVDGSLFVAIKGSKHNGASFIEEARRLGAKAFIVEKGMPVRDLKNVFFVDNPRKTLAEVCASFYGHPERKLRLIGITGTKGKTTTAVALSKILGSIGIKNIALTTVGVFGIESERAPNTTPSPSFIFPLLKRALQCGVTHAVIEVSSQALKDMRVFGLPFSAVAFTGISCDHVGAFEHPSFCDYLMAKRSLFTSYGAKFAAVYCDDEYSRYISDGVEKVVGCGFSNEADNRIWGFCDCIDGSEFYLDGTRVVTSLPGKFNAVNISIALTLASYVSGLSVSDIAEYASDVEVSGRFERFIVNGVNVIVDYAHNASSFTEILTLARRLFSGRVIAVFGSVGERSYMRRRELARVAEELADISYITTDNPGWEPPYSICLDIYFSFYNKDKARIVIDRKEAIERAINEAKSGECVLVLGRGHEDTIDLGREKIAFSDTEFVRWLSGEKHRETSV